MISERPHRGSGQTDLRSESGCHYHKGIVCTCVQTGGIGCFPRAQLASSLNITEAHLGCTEGTQSSLRRISWLPRGWPERTGVNCRFAICRGGIEFAPGIQSESTVSYVQSIHPEAPERIRCIVCARMSTRFTLELRRASAASKAHRRRP